MIPIQSSSSDFSRYGQIKKSNPALVQPNANAGKHQPVQSFGSDSSQQKVPLDSVKAYFYRSANNPKAGLRFQGVPEDAHKLWQDYMTQKKGWNEIVEEAHRRELGGRASLLKQWNIQPTGYRPKQNEDVVFRTGTDPATPVGRGEFSDEDLTANTMNAWHHLEERAKQKDLKVQHDERAGFFAIPELSTIIWKPKESIPIHDRQRFFSNLVTMSTHPEIVDPTSEQSRLSIEYVLAMVNKAQKGLCKPVKEWGNNNYERYENLIQLAKSTHHALERTDLARQFPEAYQRLWDLCKMKKSPEQLGIFSPGDSDATILKGMQREQVNMQTMMQMAFGQAQHDLKQEMQTTKQQAEHNPDSLKKTGKNTLTDFYEHLLKIKMQLKIMNDSEQHSPFMHRLFNDLPHSKPLPEPTDESLQLQSIGNVVKARRGSYHELDEQIEQQLGKISHKISVAV